MTRRLDLGASAFLALALVPALHFARLPYHFTIGVDVWNFALLLFTMSAAVAGGFALVAFPRELVLPAYGAKIHIPAFEILVPMLYFCIGFEIANAFNVVIVSVRYDGSYDEVLNRMDYYLLFGHTVPGIVGYAVMHFPKWIFSMAQAIYAALFPAIGAMLLLLGAKRGRKAALEFVGTILLAYYISLVVFFFVPAGGPYMLNPNLAAAFPNLGVSYYQRFVESQFAELLAHRNDHVISASYLMACPSMHMIQAMVLAWAARPWRRLRIVLTVYAVVLVPAILILEQHYFIDLLMGGVVAALAIMVNRRA